MLSARKRRRKEKPRGGNPAWLITFSDLVTLILTFFVLLLSMSSLSKSSIVQVNAWISPNNFIERQGAGRIPDRITILLKLIKDPNSLVKNLDRVKDLLFPEDILPEDVNKSALDESLRVMASPEGLVISLNDKLLFAPGGYSLSDEAKKILSSLVDVLLYTEMDINISGHTDEEKASGMDEYALSGKRALAVLEYFLQNKVRTGRFSVSGYGPDRPIAGNSDPAANRRVEILLKNEIWLGGYR